MRCCVLQHLAFEDLGTFAPVLLETGWTIQACHVADGLPDARDWRDADLCIVLGGPMGVHDGAAYPFLPRELELVRSRLGEGRPLLGICLGAQLMAQALGAAVYAGKAKEIGWGGHPSGCPRPGQPCRGRRTRFLPPLADRRLHRLSPPRRIPTDKEHRMKAEIISVGTELLLGHTINTDAAHVARALSSLGIDLHHACVVGDNAARLEECLRAALQRSDLVITTGGLGPTNDDLTKETVARVLGLPLEEDADSLRRLREYFGDRPVGENQYKQAWLPRGSHAFANSVGTAPGCAAPAEGGKIVILLPGPPSELLPMLHDEVVPWLARKTGACIHSSMVRTFALGEGDAELRLRDMTGAANPTVATYATDGEMFVRITAKAATAEEAAQLVAPVRDAVCRRLGEHVYGVDVENLESVVVPLLLQRGETLTTAESCTGGLLAKRITDVAGASSVFHQGVVTYANEAKTRLLGVPEELLASVGAVSPEVARCMAEQACTRYGSTWGVGISGIAGPGGATATKPVGLVYIALSNGRQTWLRVMRPHGRYMGRAWTRQRAASHALDMLRRAMLGLPVEMEA